MGTGDIAGIMTCRGIKTVMEDGTERGMDTMTPYQGQERWIHVFTGVDIGVDS